MVGGGSLDPAIAEIIADVLGEIKGIFSLDIRGNACALGAAYKVVWRCERKWEGDVRGFDQQPVERGRFCEEGVRWV
jgi:xylulokinase